MAAVLGIDPSLTATGLALPDGQSQVYKPPKCCNRGMRRLRKIRQKIMGVVEAYQPDLVVIEGYAFGARYSHSHSLGELGGAIRLALYEAGVPYIDVPPTVLKMFATGKGNASKEKVLVEAIRRLDFEGHDNNEADALWLRAFGHTFLEEPIVDLPQTHLRGLDKATYHEGIES